MEHTQRLTDAELHKGQQPSHAATLAVSDTRAPGAATGAPGPRPSALVAATERVPREQLLFGATEPAIQPRGESLPRGTRIARYAIIERLGAGGFGVVYRAHDPQLDRDVALKLLHPGAGDSDARARLLREARAAAKIRHPNVVNIHDADEVDGRVFIAMELIDGVSLRAWMARARPWRDVLDVFLKAGDGLRAAHDVGLVHRDFKPDNVLIEHSGRVRVLDFGLARPAFSEDPRPESPDDAAADTLAAGASLDLMTSALTHSGLLLGTPAYMAPEQFHHRPLDARMDQFSFCVALYEGLFGARPFAGENLPQLMHNIETASFAARPGDIAIPPALLDALTRGLAADPDARHASMRALLDALLDARARAELDPPSARGRRGLALAGGAALVLTAALLGGRLWPPGATETPPEPVSARAPTPEPSTLSGEAIAPPRDPPSPPAQLEHTPPAAACDGPLRFSARATGVAPDAALRLHWRRAGEDAFQRATMTRDPDSDAAAVLPLAQHERATIEYYLEAVDAEQRRLVTRGDPLALIRVEQRCGGKGERPPARRWCFRNTNMGGEKQCHKTQRECETDARSWLGAGKRHCRGER